MHEYGSSLMLQPDVSKGLGDNKAANANGYLQFNE